MIRIISFSNGPVLIDGPRYQQNIVGFALLAGSNQRFFLLASWAKRQDTVARTKSNLVSDIKDKWLQKKMRMTFMFMVSDQTCEQIW